MCERAAARLSEIAGDEENSEIQLVMKKDNDNSVEENAGRTPAGPLAGERLAIARREKQITVAEVAKELHLDDPKVRALEQNQFEALGAPVFAKGHLRKYAKLVGVSVEDVLGDYYSLNRATGLPQVVGKVRKPAREFTPGPWIAAAVVVLLVAIAYWWFVVRLVPDGESTISEAVPESAVSSEDSPPLDEGTAGFVGDPAESALEDDAASVPGNEDDAATTVESERTVSTPPIRPPVAAGEVRVALTFSGDCWTEITDAGGRRLFFDLGRRGRNVSVSGRAPLSVLFGNANNVNIAVNGSDYAISPSERRGQTARLTIDAR